MGTGEEALPGPYVCISCGGPGEAPHSCPYAWEIGDDHDEAYCTCCEACEQECRDAI